MTIYYLNGGEDVKKRKSFELNKKIVQESGLNPTVFIFPWSKKLDGTYDKYENLMKEYFLDCGAKKVILANEKKSFEELKKEALQSQIIYLPGGNTQEFMNNAKEYKLKEILEKYEGIIIGNSAGTMILGESYIGFPEGETRKEIMIGSGLKILPISTVSHFSIEQYEEVSNRKNQIRKPIYCIPLNQAVRIEEEKVEFIGEDIKIIS